MHFLQKKNCWEFKQCGRGPSRSNDNNNDKVCPAATEISYNGLNGGKNGGRICWLVAGTFCDGTVQGIFAQKRLSCISCDFFKLVESEEGYEEFKVLRPGQKYDPDM